VGCVDGLDGSRSKFGKLSELQHSCEALMEAGNHLCLGNGRIAQQILIAGIASPGTSLPMTRLQFLGQLLRKLEEIKHLRALEVLLIDLMSGLYKSDSIFGS
jgi:hypothetical protein